MRLWRGDVLKQGSQKIVIEADVPIVAGENQLTAYAFNRDNVKSVDAQLLVNGDASLRRAGTAYILAVGVNKYANPAFNLNFANADAQTFGEEVQKAQARMTVSRTSKSSACSTRKHEANMLGRESNVSAATSLRCRRMRRPTSPDSNARSPKTP